MKKLFSGRSVYFAAVVVGLIAGGVFAYFSKMLPSKETFVGGFAHLFPGKFLLSDLAKAFLWQFSPLLIFFYAACGRLYRPTAVLVLSIRAVVGGYCFGSAVRVFSPEPWSNALFLFLFLLFELTALVLLAACAHRGEHFSVLTVGLGIKKKPTLRFLGDLLFYSGLLVFFYLLRGCVVALLYL